MLELKNIKKSYKTHDFTQVALNNVSLKFRSHEFVTILGASGSGKTTLLNIIGGLDRYDNGDLIINGKSTKEFKDNDWDAYRNHSVGFVFQSYNLISHISVIANVEMGMTLSGVDAETKRKKAEEVLDRVGLIDHIHKKPNQLSGGQMQRVAIARALANDPDVILADEPTGALDSKTSVQIMDLIEEIAKDKLVIMVTHNPELADNYSNRVIELKDGKLISDSNPVTNTETEKDGFNLKKTSMSFLTALKLSFNNIITKKGRTILTAFASSIGIIGIALILSLSNGFDKQIDKFEADTLSNFPIMVTPESFEIDEEHIKEQQAIMSGGKQDDQYPDIDVVFPYDSKENTMIHENILNKEYIDYIEGINSDLIAGISYIRMTNINLLNSNKKNISYLKPSAINFTSIPKELGDKNDYLNDAYDLLAGTLPTNKYDIVIEVDSKNNIERSILEELGINPDETVLLEDLIGKELKVVSNNDFYSKQGLIYTMNMNLEEMYNKESNITLTVKAVVRPKEANLLSMLTAGPSNSIKGKILYSNSLMEEFIKTNSESDIVKDQQANEYNLLSGQPFETEQEKEQILLALGESDVPAMISIFPTDFKNKEEILSYLDKYNEDLDIKDQIIYTDLAKEFSNMSGNIMNAVTIVLIAFSAISLIVSSIMIGIITYISVLERTKEIGILRSLGARKKDITRVFNAETFIIGLTSGVLGITIAFLLTLPANMILESITSLPNVAILNPLHALILIITSITLTLIGGWLPAKMASNKDPVEALRTE